MSLTSDFEHYLIVINDIHISIAFDKILVTRIGWYLITEWIKMVKIYKERENANLGSSRIWRFLYNIIFSERRILESKGLERNTRLFPRKIDLENMAFLICSSVILIVREKATWPLCCRLGLGPVSLSSLFLQFNNEY